MSFSQQHALRKSKQQDTFINNAAVGTPAFNRSSSAMDCAVATMQSLLQGAINSNLGHKRKTPAKSDRTLKPSTFKNTQGKVAKKGIASDRARKSTMHSEYDNNEEDYLKKQKEKTHIKPEEFIQMIKMTKNQNRSKLRESFELAMSSILGAVNNEQSASQQPQDVEEDASPPTRFNPFYQSQSPLPAKSNNQTPTDMSPKNSQQIPIQSVSSPTALKATTPIQHRVWTGDYIKFVSQLTYHRQAVNCLACDIRSSLVFSGAENIRLTHLETMHTINSSASISPSGSLQSPLVGHNLNPRFQAAAKSETNSYISEWNGIKRKYAPLTYHKRNVQSLAFSFRHDLLISGAADGKLKFYNLYQQELNGSLEVFGRLVGLYKLLLNESETRVMVSGGTGKISIVDLETLKSLEGGSFLEHLPSAQSLCLYQPSVLMTGSSDGSFKMWDLRDKGCEFSSRAHDWITAIGRVGSSFFTTGKDGMLKIWDTAMRKVVNSFDFQEPVLDALPVGDKVLLASGKYLNLVGINYQDNLAEDENIHIIETQNAQRRIKCLYFDRRLFHVYAGCGDGGVVCWKVSPLISNDSSQVLPVQSPMTIVNSLKF